MPKEFERPEDKIILEDREAAGLWKAIALSKEIGETEQSVSLEVILELHRLMFADAMPEIAGRFRKSGEDVKKLTCIEPPLGTVIHEKMHNFGKDLAFKISHMPKRPKAKPKKKYRQWVDSVFDLAAWTQHQLVAIHPFCEGNGRVARLMTNIILRHFGMPPTDVKIESEDKPKYIHALCEIDEHSDYRALRDMLLKGSISSMKREQEKRQKKQVA